MENNTTGYVNSKIKESGENITAIIYVNISESFTLGYDDVSDNVLFILHVFPMVIYSVVFLLGTTGNGLVIWFTVFRMKKTLNVVWFLNPAIANFIFTFFLLRIIYLALSFDWRFGKLICKSNSQIAFINMFASIFLLTVISIDRCISVIFPVWCQNHRSPRLSSIIALVVWTLAFVFSLPNFIFRNTVESDGYVFCYNNFGEVIDGVQTILGKSRHRDTVITRFIVGFVISFYLIVICYSVIAFRIHRNHIATSTKPFKVTLAVIISFFFCWFPYHIFSFLVLSEKYQTDLYDVLLVGIRITSSLAFISSCLNPVLYVFIGWDFKKTSCVSIQSIFEKVFTEDTLHTDLQSKPKSTSYFQLV